SNGNSGNGLHIVVDTSQNSGLLALFETDTGTDLFSVSEGGEVLVGDSIGNTTATSALEIGSGNTATLNLCVTTGCDTINVITNTDADTLNIGIGNNDTINIASAVNINTGGLQTGAVSIGS